jgi:uncharacterized membrane protein
MTRDPLLPGPEDDEPPEEPDVERRLRPTPTGLLAVAAVVGIAAGWLLHRVSVDVRGTAPTVGWPTVVALFFLALVLGGVAWSTHRTLHRRQQRMEAHHAVNRLVLAKSCAVAGALLAGGYLGYAISWLNVRDSELATQRLVQSLLAAAAGALVVTAALLLERACRVGDSDTRP